MAPARTTRGWPVVVRRVTADDKADVLGFATSTWDGWDYIPSVFDGWVAATDGVFLGILPGRAADGGLPRDADGEPLDTERVIAIARVTFLSEEDAWIEGIRVDPRVRGMGIATDLQVAELRWAAAHGARHVRYVTGQHNEGSHRLGARHGFEMLGAVRWYGRNDEDDADPPVAVTEDGGTGSADATVAADLILDDDHGGAWWAAVAVDATFQAAHRLYEPRSWALCGLTEDRFRALVAARRVLVWPVGVTEPSAAPNGRWALAIRRPGPEGEDDPSRPLSPALVAGDAGAVLDILRVIGSGRAGMPEVRLPDPDPPILRDGGAEAWTKAGWGPMPRTTHVFARDIDADHPVPEPDDAALLTYGEEPRRVAQPRRP